jgi:acyl transferase domain-containing protein/acyl carrier protein
METDERLREYLKKVTLELRKTQARLREVSDQKDHLEPIAIVGISCRYPGDVDGPEALWRLLVEERDATTDAPEDRGWDLSELVDTDPDKKGKAVSLRGGFVRDAGSFDAGFFGISPREASAMDPQQRLVLEAAWEALERGRIAPATLAGSATAVFVGLTHSDYASGDVPPELEGFKLVGGAASVASGRVAYTLGLHGPAVTLDTACSSSLVAIHLACQELREGRSELALAGGVVVMAGPTAFVEFSRQRGLAPDGRSKPFSAAADGVGWAEGVGMLVLERLSDARRNGHEVLAVIAGSAVNQDGKSQGLTAPNALAQERVIRAALEQAKLSPADVDVVEAHGTGTTLGDPIEAEALLATYGTARGGDPLWLGSIKSNFGHTQAAAGVTGVIKMVIALQNELLPRSLHAEEPSPHVDWSAGAVSLLNHARPWPRGGRVRRAAVSAFGLSGTNAHLILEEAPSVEERSPESGEVLTFVPFLVSGKDDRGLRAQAERLLRMLAERPAERLVDIAFSLATTRSVFEERALIVVQDRDALFAELSLLARGETGVHTLRARARAQASLGGIAFAFAGQGSQLPRMGRGLALRFPAFRGALEEALSAFDGMLPVPLREVLDADAGSPHAALLDSTEYAQPALFCLEVALFRQLAALGLTPHALLGHSLGELSAAHVAGVFSLPDAARVVAARGRLMQALPSGGAMLALDTGAEQLEALLREVGGDLSLAALNAPKAVVASGEGPAIARLEALASARGVRTKRLVVSHAFHSALMDPMLPDFRRVIDEVERSSASIPLVSNVSGTLAPSAQYADSEYWVRHVRAAVRFADGVRAAREAGAEAYLELGPSSVLSGLVRETLGSGDRALVVPTLAKRQDEAYAFVRALAALHVHGYAVDWRAFFAPFAPRTVALPTYPFARDRYWVPTRKARADVARFGLSDTRHPVLGLAIHIAAGGQSVFSGRVEGKELPGLVRGMDGRTVIDSALLLELALAAGMRVGARTLAAFGVVTPLVLTGEAGLELQLSVGAVGLEGTRQLQVFGRPARDEDWTLHAQGEFAAPIAAPLDSIAGWPPSTGEALHVDVPTVTSVVVAGEDTLAELALSEDDRAEAERFALHPALVRDLMALFAQRHGLSLEHGMALEGVELFAHAADALRVKIRRLDGDAFSVEGWDVTGEPVLRVRRARSVGVSLPEHAARNLYRVEYVAARASALEPRVRMAVGGQPVHWATRCVRSVEEGAHEPNASLVYVPDEREDGAAATRALLEHLQTFLRLAEPAAHFIVLTRGAVCAREGDSLTAPAQSALWGLVRSAQSEATDRVIRVVDVDADVQQLTESEWAAVLVSPEPAAALRAGELLVPRLVRAEPGLGITPLAGLDAGTVLITGGTGALGAHVARHLVGAHGVRSLVLCSRTGEATALVHELESLGANVRVVACDVSSRASVASLLDSLDQPLSAIFHAAGISGDGVLSAQTHDDVDAVFAGKVAAARHLDALTRDQPLVAFVMFSSVAALLGPPGQGIYAAANAYLDGLARQRRGAGLAALALDWGYWDVRSAVSGNVGERDVARMKRAGVHPLSVEQGLALLDLSLRTGDSQLVPARLVFDSEDASVRYAPIFSELLPRVLRRARSAERATTAATLGRAEHRGQLERMVLAAIGSALALDPARIELSQPLAALGLDSLMAVEIRNQLSAGTGERLPATLLYDYPTAAAVRDYLSERLFGGKAADAPTHARAADGDPVAIVGVGFRLPGGADSPEALWDLLQNGRHAISELPRDRGWDVEGLYDSDPEARGKSTAKHGGFLRDPAGFDARFFGISPREALTIDPQQRLLLEATWEALERAGIAPDSLAGSATGTFVGAYANDYAAGAEQRRPELEGQLGLGSATAVASGRIAYTLGLRGPALTIDTACSSSLYTWRASPCAKASATLPSPPVQPYSPRRAYSSNSAASATWRRMASASPSRSARTARRGPRAWSCWCSSASRMPSATATPCSRSSAAAHSIRTAAVRGSRLRTDRRRRR